MYVANDWTLLCQYQPGVGHHTCKWQVQLLLAVIIVIIQLSNTTCMNMTGWWWKTNESLEPYSKVRATTPRNRWTKFCSVTDKQHTCIYCCFRWMLNNNNFTRNTISHSETRLLRALMYCRSIYSFPQHCNSSRKKFPDSSVKRLL